MPENMLVASLNQEMTRRMMNTSELLDMQVRVEVINKYGQKLTNSGFMVEQARNIVTGGLVSYERRVKQSQDKTSPRWRPLHEGAKYNKAQRMKKKIMAKSSWFKAKKRDNDGEVDSGSGGGVGTKEPSPKKKLRMDEGSKGEGDKVHKSRWRKRRQDPAVKVTTSKQTETITVMFVDQTPGGVLAKRLQEAEDRIAKITGYRIRMVETSGTQLGRMLPNTNPWSGMHCSRSMCFTCNQGDEKLQDCKKRSLLYESVCVVCEADAEAVERGNGDPRKSKRGLSSHGGVYVGETARSVFERAAEHRDDAENHDEDSHMVKHWLLAHPEEENMPVFRFQIVASFQDCLTRQVAESVRIDRRMGKVLNSKTEYSRCKLPRLTVDVEEWRKQRDAMVAADKEIERVEVAKAGELEQEVVPGVGYTQKRPGMMEDGGRKKKRRRLEPLVGWGEHPVEDSVGEIDKWLHSPMVTIKEVTEVKQTSIKNFAIESKEILRRKADDWVRGCLLDDVWGRVMELQEVRECVLALEADVDGGEEMIVPASPLMTNTGLDLKVTRKKLKKPKPISKKARKELEFKELVASTRKITGWLTVPAETETNEIFVRKTELSHLTVLGMKVPEERTEMEVKVVDHMEARDMITLDKDSGVEMAYWAKDIFVQDPQAGVQDTQAGLQDTQDGAQDVEVAQVQKKMVKQLEIASLETETGKVIEQVDLSFLLQGYQLKKQGPVSGVVEQHQDVQGGSQDGGGEEGEAESCEGGHKEGGLECGGEALAVIELGQGRADAVDLRFSDRVVRKAGRRKKATMIASNQSLILEYLQQKCAPVGILGEKSNSNSNRGPKRKGTQMEGPEPGCKVSRSEEIIE